MSQVDLEGILRQAARLDEAVWAKVVCEAARAYTGAHTGAYTDACAHAFVAPRL